MFSFSLPSSGVDPNADYPTLYRYFVEVWIYLGLAWLSLFFNWKVRMVVEAHKALKKRRKLRKLSLDELRHYKEAHKASPRLPPTPNDVNIFGFLSKKQEGYNDLIKQIRTKRVGDMNGSGGCSPTGSSGDGGCGGMPKDMSRSKSCNDTAAYNGHPILSLDQSPRQKRRYSFSDRVTVAFSKSKSYLLGSDSGLLLTDDLAEGEVEADQDRMYENQLDKDVDLEHGGRLGGGDGSGMSGRRMWESKDYQPLTFQNANITFIDEDNFLNTNLEEKGEDVEEDDDDDDADEDYEEDEGEEDDAKAKLSVTTCDENVCLSETDSKEEQGSELEGSVFTSDGSEHSHSYEELVEEYAKEDNTDC